ncbi:AraC family transcriptional regulator [Cohnella sp. GbtcB17]|uniref:AraC family transcriptional regulator n=1 Tax=Cohnella sp. GbtcB17 TaxID=2824762 RepID=UPI001C30115B|nr:AraC family transcriptional regulator [Cohnella sp. GbtcB17]
MGILRLLRSRRYLQRILLYFNLSVVGMLVLFSFSYYFYSKDIVLQTQKEANEKVLSQIKYNINYLNQIVQNIAIMISFDKSMIYLMNAREPDPFTKFQTLRMLDTVADSTSFVDSISVYSGASGQLYVGGSGPWTRDHLPELKKMTLDRLQEAERSPSGRLVPMKTDKSSPNVDLFSFFVLEGHPSNGSMPNAVIVNIRPQWIFDNITNLNELADHRDGGVLLVQHGQALAYSGEDAAALGETERRQLSEIIAAGQPDELAPFSVRRLNGEKYFISETGIGFNDWRIVSALRYDQVMGRVESFRDISFILIGLALAASIVLSAAIANRLYKPIGRLTELFKRNSPDSGAGSEISKTQDEMSFISGVYELTLHKLQLAYRDESRNQQIVNDYYLRRWLTDSESITEEELKTCGEAYPGLFEENGGEERIWQMAVLALDPLPQSGGLPAVADDLYRFAVGNITEELLARSCPVRVLDMKNDFMVVITRVSARSADSAALRECLAEAIETCRQYYRRTFSAAVSDPVTDGTSISRVYHATVQQLMYRLLFGAGSIITSADVADNMYRQDAAIPLEWEKKLGEGIRARDLKAIQAALDKWFEAIATFPYDYMTFAVQQLVLVIKRVLREPVFASHFNSVEMQTLGDKVIRSDTLAEMRQKIERFLEQVCQAEREAQKEDKSKIVVAAMKEFIEKNALDVNISLQSIAANFKMSPAYIGRIFKQCEHVSVSDYITGYRLDKARDMLLGSDFSVKEIADYLGFNNASYFITLFKKRFGITPKEFRMNATLEGEKSS